jgi:hypothetical protein
VSDSRLRYAREHESSGSLKEDEGFVELYLETVLNLQYYWNRTAWLFFDSLQQNSPLVIIGTPVVLEHSKSNHHHQIF